MLWMIMGRDVPDSTAARAAARPAHLERLHKLHAEGRLVLAGPLPNDTEDATTGMHGSLIVAEFTSRADAQSWADADPYCAAGVYQSVTIHAFKKVLP